MPQNESDDKAFGGVAHGMLFAGRLFSERIIQRGWVCFGWPSLYGETMALLCALQRLPYSYS